jgi:hypothetical protein
LNGLRFESTRGSLEQRSAGDEESFIGKSVLSTEAGTVLAIADFYCYVRPVADNRLLAWYTRESSCGHSLRLELFDVDSLLPIANVARGLLRAGRRRQRRTQSGRSLVSHPQRTPSHDE